MLFYLIPAFFATFLPTSVNSNESENKRPLEIAVLLDSPRLIDVDEYTSSITIVFNLLIEPINRTQKIPETFQKLKHSSLLHFENSIVDSPTSSPLPILSVESFGLTRVVKLHLLCDVFKLDNHPNDDHTCRLSLISNVLNATNLLLVPHVTTLSTLKANLRWKADISKTYVQWIVQNNETYEKAIFEWNVYRQMNRTHLVIWVLYFWNVFSLSLSYPLIWNGKLSKPFSYGAWMCVGETLILLSLSSDPILSDRWTAGFRKAFALYSYGLACCTLSNYLPALLLMLRLLRSDAHPYPSLYPSPEEQISLDSERTRLTAVLDSARLDSARSTRTTQMESCLAELKYTLVHLNEFMNYKANGQYRRFLWTSSYNRLLAFIGVILQLFNGAIFLMSL